MDAETYLERVIRFLETKGWNTATTRVNERTCIVTGTRESDTYYDRMLTMVLLDGETQLSTDHVEYLASAGEEHDVDHLLATCRAGLTEEATELMDDHGVEFVDTATIDDAFIDEFSVEGSAATFERARDRGPGLGASGSIRRPVQYLSALSAVVGAVLTVFVLVSGTFLAGDWSARSLAGVGLLVATTVAIVGTIGLTCRGVETPPSPAGLGFGGALGYLIVVFSLATGASTAGSTGSVDLFVSPEGALVVAISAVSVGCLGAAVVYVERYLIATPTDETP